MNKRNPVLAFVVVIIAIVVAIYSYLNVFGADASGGKFDSFDNSKIPPPTPGKSLPVPPVPSTFGGKKK